MNGKYYFDVQDQGTNWQWLRSVVDAPHHTDIDDWLGKRVGTCNSAAFVSNLQGMSLGQLEAYLLASHHDRLHQVIERPRLQVYPSSHPLHTHAHLQGINCSPVRGTLAIARSLQIAEHPQDEIDFSNPVDPLQTIRLAIPRPVCGDILVVMHDEQGPYAVNWLFDRGFGGVQSESGTAQISDQDKIATSIINDFADTQLIEQYFQDAGIRTQHIESGEIKPVLAANLALLAVNITAIAPLNEYATAHMVNEFSELVGSTTTVAESIGYLSKRHRCEPAHCRVVLLRGIARRQIRVDLMRPISIDLPLEPEQRDVLVDFDEWFRR